MGYYPMRAASFVSIVLYLILILKIDIYKKAHTWKHCVVKDYVASDCQFCLNDKQGRN